MIDFFNNLPPEAKDTEAKISFHSKLSTYNISKEEISSLTQMQGLMKLTLPTAPDPESFKVQKKEKPSREKPNSLF